MYAIKIKNTNMYLQGGRIIVSVDQSTRYGTECFAQIILDDLCWVQGVKQFCRNDFEVVEVKE